MRRALLAALTAASSSLVATTAEAYTVRNTPSGAPVRWGTDTVEVILDGSLGKVDPGARSAAAAAFGTWNAVADARTPGIVTRDGDADELGYRPGGQNHSTVRYAPKGSALAGGALAITILTYDNEGTILDADVIVNGGKSRKFGVLTEAVPAQAGADHGQNVGKEDEPGSGKDRYDLQNVITHEAGHVFGLGEELADTSATMFITSARGETQKRDLTADDESGIRILYDEALAKPAAGTSCALRPLDAGSPLSAFPWIAVGMLGLWATRRRSPGMVAIAIASLGLAGCLASTGPSDDAGGDAVASVVGASAHWEAGVVVTRLTLRPITCNRRAGCPSADVSVDVLGGTIAGITQVVGHHDVPRLGETLPLSWNGARIAWPERFPIRRGAPNEPERPDPEAQRPLAMTTLPSRTKLDPRRLHERAPAEIDVIVRADGREIHGLSENISKGGLFVATDGATNLRGTIEVVFQLPGRAEPVHARGEIRWSRSSGEDEPAGLGIQFVELDGEAAELIRQMVEQDFTQ